MKTKILLRKAKKNDVKWLFNLRNDREAYRHFFNSKPVEWKDHLTWFEKIIADEKVQLYIAHDKSHPRIGMMRFTIKNNVADVSVNVDKRFRDLGYGKEIIQRATDVFMENNRGVVTKIVAKIKKSNTKSVDAFTAAGYKLANKRGNVLVYEHVSAKPSSDSKNLLLTCAGGSGPIYIAKKLSKNFNIFLVDGADSSVAQHLGFPYAKIPFGNSPDYVTSLKNLVKKYGIEWIVPGADEELEKVAAFTTANESVNAVVPNIEFIKTCLNKKLLMDVLNDKDLSDLQYYKSVSKIKYPVIVKPIFGRGSRGVHVVENPSQLKGYLKLYNKKFKDVLVQRKVEGEEYTVSVIVNNLNKMIGIVPKRVILKRGITRIAVSERNNVINKVCEEITRKMNPCGPFNVQLILEKGKAKIFEINPRLSTTSVLTDKAFGNEVELFIKYFNKTKINLKRELKKDIYLYRYEENVFV